MKRLVKFKAVETYDDVLRKRLILLNEKIKKLMEQIYNKEKFLHFENEEISSSFTNKTNSNEVLTSCNDYKDYNMNGKSLKRKIQFDEKGIDVIDNDKVKTLFSIENFNKMDEKSRNKKFKIKPFNTVIKKLNFDADEKILNDCQEFSDKSSYYKTRNDVKDFAIGNFQSERSNNKKFNLLKYALIDKSEKLTKSPIKIISSLIKPSTVYNCDGFRKFLITNSNTNEKMKTEATNSSNTINENNDLGKVLNFNIKYKSDFGEKPVKDQSAIFRKKSKNFQNQIKNIHLIDNENFFEKTRINSQNAENKINQIKSVNSFEKNEDQNGEMNTKNFQYSISKNSDSFQTQNLIKSKTLKKPIQKIRQSDLRNKYFLIEKVISGIYSISVEEDLRNKKILSHTLDSHILKRGKRNSIMEGLKTRNKQEELQDYYKIFNHHQMELNNGSKEKKKKEY